MMRLLLNKHGVSNYRILGSRSGPRSAAQIGDLAYFLVNRKETSWTKKIHKVDIHIFDHNRTAGKSIQMMPASESVDRLIQWAAVLRNSVRRDE